MPRNLKSILVSLVLGLVLACGGGDGGPKPPNIQITISPTQASLTAGQTQNFTATVTGTPNSRVIWSIQEGPGSGGLNDGNYLAPPASGTYHVVATSVADPSKSAIATVTVTAIPKRRLELVAGAIGGPGSLDGVGTAAQFNGLGGVVMDRDGNTFVADGGNHTIRKISSTGNVSTFAGSPGQIGSGDGVGASARFFGPAGLATDALGNLFVSDSGNFTIRKISPSGQVTTFAGKPGSFGSEDGPGNLARFFSPYGLTFSATGDLYVADFSNHTIRKITSEGVVSTFAGAAGLNGSVDGPASSARFFRPNGLVFDTNDNLFVTDGGNHTVRKITPSGTVSTLAGSPGFRGYSDGTGSSARFDFPDGITIDTNGNLYVASGSQLKKVSPSGVVTTLAGKAGVWGHLDGTGTSAKFAGLKGLALGASGDIFATENGELGHTIRKITSQGVATTVAGTVDYTGYRDGVGSEALFDRISQAAVDAAGNIYVADAQNYLIRKITLAGQTSIFAGNRFPGYQDGVGTNALFGFPEGIAIDGIGNLYIADTGNHVIRKITPDRVVTTVAGIPGDPGDDDGVFGTARLRKPNSVTVDPSGIVYVGSLTAFTVRKISPGGQVTTLAGLPGQPGIEEGTGATARFMGLTGLVADPTGNVFVWDAPRVRKITPQGVVTTFAGDYYKQGWADGIDSDAQFSSGPAGISPGIAMDSFGNLFVADFNNHVIRQISPTGVVSTIVGRPKVSGTLLGEAPGGLSYPSAIAVAPNGDLILSSTNAILRAPRP